MKIARMKIKRHTVLLFFKSFLNMEFISKIIYKASQAVLNINLPQPSTSTDEGLAFIDKIMRPRPSLHFPPKDGEPQTFKPFTDDYGNTSSPFLILYQIRIRIQTRCGHPLSIYCDQNAQTKTKLKGRISWEKYSRAKVPRKILRNSLLNTGNVACSTVLVF